jgi:hypothetical protein
MVKISKSVVTYEYVYGEQTWLNRDDVPNALQSKVKGMWIVRGLLGTLLAIKRTLDEASKFAGKNAEIKLPKILLKNLYPLF